MLKCSFGLGFVFMVVALGVVLNGCGGERLACTLQPRDAIVVEIIDKATGEPLVIGSSVIAVDGFYRDSIEAKSPPLSSNAANVAVADERPGTYLVTVRRPGYKTWVQANVVVTGDRCGPTKSAALQVLLERE